MSYRIALLALIAATSLHGAIIDGLVGYWDWETDLSNGGSAGSAGDAQVIGGGGIPGWSGGIVTRGDGTSNRSSLLIGNAANFVDIDNDRLQLPFGSSELGDSFAISTWYYLSPNSSNGSTRFFVFEASTSYDVSYGISSGDTYASYVGQNFIDSTVTSRNAWHHVLHNFTASSGTTTLDVYIDGVFEGSGTAPTANVDFAAINLGRHRSTSGDRDWDGLIDETAIWDRTLLPGEISALYSAGLSGVPVTSIPEPGTVIAFAALLLGLAFYRHRQTQ